MILKFIDRIDGECEKIEKTIDNVKEIYKTNPTEKKAIEWMGKTSYNVPSSIYGCDGIRPNSDTKVCTFLTVTRHNPISDSGYEEQHILYHSKGNVCRVTLYSMNDKGVTIDRIDV